MNKRQIKIEALKTAYGLCTSVDHSMWDYNATLSIKDQAKILKTLYDIGWKLYLRAEKLEKRKK